MHGDEKKHSAELVEAREAGVTVNLEAYIDTDSDTDDIDDSSDIGDNSDFDNDDDYDAHHCRCQELITYDGISWAVDN